MIQLQLLSKVLSSGNNSIIEDNFLTRDYFTGYEEEYDFIQEHKNKYGNVPDTATFLAKFPDVELVECNETDKFLVDTIREEHLYYQSIPVVQKVAELLKSDANAAADDQPAETTTAAADDTAATTTAEAKADDKKTTTTAADTKKKDTSTTTATKTGDAGVGVVVAGLTLAGAAAFIARKKH